MHYRLYIIVCPIIFPEFGVLSQNVSTLAMKLSHKISMSLIILRNSIILPKMPFIDDKACMRVSYALLSVHLRSLFHFFSIQRSRRRRRRRRRRFPSDDRPFLPSSFVDVSSKHETAKNARSRLITDLLVGLELWFQLSMSNLIFRRRPRP